MFGRAEFQRTVILVVALPVTAGSAGALAREFSAADSQREDCPAARALRFMGGPVRARGRQETRAFHSRRPGAEKETLEQTRAGSIDPNRTHVALPFPCANPIERIRKVE